MATHGEQTIRIWDVKNWKELYCLDRFHYLPSAMAFSLDGSSLWHHRDGKEVVLWDIKSAAPVGAVQLLVESTSHQGPGETNQHKRHPFSSSLTCSPRGSALLMEQIDDMDGIRFRGAVYELDVQAARKFNQTVLSETTVETPEHLLARISYPRISGSSAGPSIQHSQGVAIAPDSSHVAVFGQQDVLVIDASDPRNRRSLDYPEDRFDLGRSTVWSQAGNLLSTLGESEGTFARTIVQWNIETGERTLLAPDIPSIREQQPWSDVQDVLTCLDYSPDGRVMAVGNRAGNVILIDSGSGKVLRTLLGSGRNVPIKQVVFVAGGTAIVGYGFEVLRWQLAESDQPVKPHVLFKPAGDGFVMSANGKLGSSVINRGTEIVIQDLGTGKVLGSWKPNLEEIEGIHVSADGTFLAAWPGLKRDSEAGQVHLHHLPAKHADVVLRHPKPKYSNRHSQVQTVCFADDDQRIITSDTRAIWIWENVLKVRNVGVSAND